MNINETQDRMAEAATAFTQAAKDSPDGVEVASEPVKQLTRRFYDLLQAGFNSKTSEDTDAKVYDYLKNYLTSQNEFFITQYVENYSQGKQIEKKVAGVLILCIQERLLSGLFLKIMADRDFKSNYKEGAPLLDPKLILWIIDELHKIELLKIELKSKWVDGYLTKKSGPKNGKPRINFEMTPAPKKKESRLDQLEGSNGFELSDAVRRYISDGKAASVLDFESKTKERLRNELLTQSGVKNESNVTLKSKMSTISEPQRINLMYNEVLRRNQLDVSETNSLEDSKETFLQDGVITSEIITTKFIAPHIHLAELFLAGSMAASKLTGSKPMETKGREKCPDCGTELTSGFFGVLSSEKLPILRIGKYKFLQKLYPPRQDPGP